MSLLDTAGHAHASSLTPSAPAPAPLCHFLLSPDVTTVDSDEHEADDDDVVEVVPTRGPAAGRRTRRAATGKSRTAHTEDVDEGSDDQDVFEDEGGDDGGGGDSDDAFEMQNADSDEEEEDEYLEQGTGSRKRGRAGNTKAGQGTKAKRAAAGRAGPTSQRSQRSGTASQRSSASATQQSGGGGGRRLPGWAKKSSKSQASLQSEQDEDLPF